jgi:hypothetical protein
LSIVATLTLAAGLSATTAAAKPCSGGSVQGGNSEVDQYTETVPGACGNEQTGGSNGGDSGGTPLSPGATEALQGLGADGASVARFAEETSPGAGRDAGSGNGAAGATGTGSAGDDGSSGFGALIDAAGGSDDGGMGILLPLILGGVALAGLSYALLRRRDGEQPA